MITPEQALQLLDHAASSAQGNRAEHEQIKVSVKVLSDFILSVRLKEQFAKPEEKIAHD